MDILTELASRVDQVEVLDVRREATSVTFEANELKGSQVEETSGIAVRVVADGRLGFAASSDPSATDRLVRNVIESARYGPEIPIAFPAPSDAPEVTTYDDAIADLPISRLVEIGHEIIDLIRQVEPEVRIDVTLTRGIEHTSIRNQAGTDIAFRRSPLSISCDVSRVREDDVLLAHRLSGTTVWDDDVLRIARDLAARLELARRRAEDRQRPGRAARARQARCDHPLSEDARALCPRGRACPGHAARRRTER